MWLVVMLLANSLKLGEKKGMMNLEAEIQANYIFF